MKGALKQISMFGKTFKYRISELETEFLLPGGKSMTFTNWDVKGVRERFYREEYLNPEVHYNQPKEPEPSEFGIRASDVLNFIKGNEDKFDPLPPVFEPIQVAGREPKSTKGQRLSEAHSA